MTLSEILARQRRYFAAGRTLDTQGRINNLRRLRCGITAMQAQLTEALRLDLGKGKTESYLTEIGMALDELSYQERHLAGFSKPRRVATPLSQMPASSWEIPEPMGSVLILSPWNYPFLLSIGPAIDALAAGCTVVIKPSELAVHTSAAVEQLLRSCLPPELATVVPGGIEQAQALLEQKFDLIFYTGSARVGRLVLERAARRLTPVILELGGKSPCIVDQGTNLAAVARRIVFGKLLNAGQTCVAPDYILVRRGMREALVRELGRAVKSALGNDPLGSADYPRIIDRAHFDRLVRLIGSGEVLFGGQSDPETLRIAPTLLGGVTFSSPVMQEEIFGPILPILEVGTLEEAFALVNAGPRPLAAYLFTKNAKAARRFTREVQFGGGCVNDTVVQLANPNLGFGGVGDSGMGSYHGKRGFDAFTHDKAVVHRAFWPDFSLRYRPYTDEKLRKIKLFLR
ncbi:MAG: aldehyde dehydrogenase [Oscillospiraceae bacterium]